MNTFRCRAVKSAHEILVNTFRQKRNHRRGCFADCHKCCIQRHVCINLILLHSLCPETVAATAHIPVTHIIHKTLQCFCSLRNFVILQIVIHRFYCCIQTGQQPFIHNCKFIIIKCMLCWIKLVDLRIQNIKCIGIPKGTHEFTLSLDYCLSVETVRQPRRTVCIEIPADSICSVFFQCFKRVNGISLALTHLLPVFILYMAKYDDIFIWCLVK